MPGSKHKTKRKPNLPKIGLLIVIALMGYFALLAQFYINMNNSVADASEVILRYFSYFTLTTNLLVAICCTSLLFSSGSRNGSFFSMQKTQAASAVYIIIVGVIYNLILRALWKPVGLQQIVDELLHSIIPVLYVSYWLIFASKDRLKWSAVWLWLIYPLIYLIYIMFIGLETGFFPYPFINLNQLGFNKVMINSAVIAMAFLVISFLFVWLGKLLSKYQTVRSSGKRRSGRHSAAIF